MEDIALGMIDTSTYEESLHELIARRSLGALPFMGRYRLIDFPLTNLVRSGIWNIAVLMQFYHRSLFDHLRSGKDWDLSRKHGGLYLFPFQARQDIPTFHVDTLRHTADYLKKCTEPYVVLSNVYEISRIRFNKYLKAHKDSGASITNITHQNQKMNVYIVDRTFLLEILENPTQFEGENIGEIYTHLSENLTNCEPYDGYLAKITSLEAYYEESMKLLNRENFTQLFLSSEPVLTKVKDQDSTRYLAESDVSNCIIANGCQINGTVENSILFRGVKVDSQAIVRNSIVMQRSEIGTGAEVDHLIIDKENHIGAGEKRLETSPTIQAKNGKQGMVYQT